MGLGGEPGTKSGGIAQPCGIHARTMIPVYFRRGCISLSARRVEIKDRQIGILGEV